MASDNGTRREPFPQQILPPTKTKRETNGERTRVNLPLRPAVAISPSAPKAPIMQPNLASNDTRIRACMFAIDHDFHARTRDTGVLCCPLKHPSPLQSASARVPQYHQRQPPNLTCSSIMVERGRPSTSLTALGGILGATSPGPANTRLEASLPDQPDTRG